MRYPNVDWRPSPNHSQGGLVKPAKGVVLHIMGSSLSAADNWFHNPNAQVSAHFGIGYDGHIVQWVDTDDKAWHAMAANSHWYGIETEGSGGPLSDAQLSSFAAIYRWLEATDHFGFSSTDDPNGQGLGWHGMGGAAWGNHVYCPGEARKAQRGQILALAQGQGQPSPSPTPTPQPAPGHPQWPGRYIQYPPVTNGNDVRTWQQQMKNRGWTITADGSYGPASKNVCFHFQSEKHLTADGVIGPQTWDAAWTAPRT